MAANTGETSLACLLSTTCCCGPVPNRARGPLQRSYSWFFPGPENSASEDQPLPTWQKSFVQLKLSCSLGCVSSYPTMELACFMSKKLKTRVHRKTVHSEENGHRLRLVKQMQQISLVERSKLKCLAHGVQSPKKWFLCIKKRKERTSKTLVQGNNKSWLQPPHGLASCGASSKGAHAFNLHTGWVQRCCHWGIMQNWRLGSPQEPSFPCPLTQGQLDTLPALSS